jgi:putative methylase
MDLTPNTLAIILSRLAVFKTPSMRHEQYPTPGDIAGTFLFSADFSGKHIIDLGAGTGLLGIGALLLGARHVTFIDVDEDALEIAQRNCASVNERFEGLGQASFMQADVAAKFTVPDVDIIIMNPPFGTKQKHADKLFLSKAIGHAPLILSMHKTSTMQHLITWMGIQGYELSWSKEVDFPIRASMHHHTKPKAVTHVMLCCWQAVS